MKIRSTTILSVRHNGQVAIGGDGQVTMESVIAKADAINQNHPDKALPVECNAVDKNSVEQALAETLDHFGTIDLLLNGAGGSHPTTTTHQRVSADERAQLGIHENMVRLSVGLEDVEDLKEDMAQAMKA